MTDALKMAKEILQEDGNKRDPRYVGMCADYGWHISQALVASEAKLAEAVKCFRDYDREYYEAKPHKALEMCDMIDSFLTRLQSAKEGE